MWHAPKNNLYSIEINQEAANVAIPTLTNGKSTLPQPYDKEKHFEKFNQKFQFGIIQKKQIHTQLSNCFAVKSILLHVQDICHSTSLPFLLHTSNEDSQQPSRQSTSTHERVQEVKNVATQTVATEAAFTTAELVSFPA